MCVYCITLVTFVLVQNISKLKKKKGNNQHGQQDKPSLFSLRSVQGSLHWGRCVSRVLIWINLMVT